MRLRDLGGIIIIDFIDMDTSDHRQRLYKRMKELMSADRAKHNILPITKFGLMQITRQRVRAAMEINTVKNVPVVTEQARFLRACSSRKILRTSCLSLPERKIEEDNTGSTSFYRSLPD